MSDENSLLQWAGLVLATLAFLVLTGLLTTRFKGRSGSRRLWFASLATALWAAASLLAPSFEASSPFLVFLVEFGRDGAWLIFLASVLSGAIGGWFVRALRIAAPGIVVCIVVYGTLLEFGVLKSVDGSGASSITVIGKILTALAVLVYLEQIYRNARDAQRQGLKFLCLGIGIVFAFDLLLYSNASLVGHIDPLLKAARGYIVAMAVPFIALAARRSPSWSGGIFVSRQIVFHTATVFAAGAYLTVGGLIAHYVRELGGQWGGVAQIVFIAAIVVAMLAAVLSSRLRARIRVFISKHFYQNKYDYRAEWLRLTQTLTDSDDALTLKKRSVKALADIVGCSSGVLFLRSEDESEFVGSVGWNCATPLQRIAESSPLVGFLRRSKWIVEFDELRDDPERYEGLALSGNQIGLENAGLIVPLVNENDLIGFVALSAGSVTGHLDYEDRDLLKTAGRQVASFLMQQLSTELLTQSRQFEAFNKLTAYLMHDLKNVIAQQSLVVENAAKYKNNPEFIEDAVSTIESGVTRMRRVIEQLQQGVRRRSRQRVEVGEIIMRATSKCADRQPVPTTELCNDRIWVRGDRDELQMAITHTIRNAQDACEESDKITVALRTDAKHCDIAVSDTGSGMSEEFVQNRLFKPFDSTKGTQGMGIGAYQVREVARSMGGALLVESRQSGGTTMTIRIPLIQA